MDREAPTDKERVYLALNLFIGTGLNINLKRFFLGTKFRYRPVISPIPGAPIEKHPLTQFQVLLYGGAAF